MSRQVPPRDLNYQVAGLSIGMKALVTTALEAAMDYAFIGAAMPEEHSEIEERFHIARHNLERGIMNQIEKERKKK